MARSKKTTNKNEVTEVNNPAQVLPAPAVDDATTTKGTKAKPIAAEAEKSPSKSDLFTGLRQFLNLDSDTAKVNAEAGRLIVEGMQPLDAVAQARKMFRGCGSDSCTEAEFLTRLAEYPEIKDLCTFLGISEDVSGLSLMRSGSVCVYHAQGDDSEGDDSEGDDSEGAKVAEAAKVTILGAEFSSEFYYSLRPQTWRGFFLAFKSLDIPRRAAEKARRQGKQLIAWGDASAENTRKMIDAGADRAAVVKKVTGMEAVELIYTVVKNELDTQDDINLVLDHLKIALSWVRDETTGNGDEFYNSIKNAF